MNIKHILAERIEDALAACGAAGDAVIQVSGKPGFGDYQANGVMGAAKRAKRNPRDLAADVIKALDVAEIASNVEVAGPGFINFTLTAEFLAAHTTSPHAAATPVSPITPVSTVVVDYSSPNLAKEMHVGHLRSTIIGDAIARVLEALGQHVIRQNHVGDWGTQFGMLLTLLEDLGEAAGTSRDLADLESFYRAAKQRFDDDESFQDRSRRAVVGLQSGDPAALAQWQRFIDISMSHCQAVYDTLGVTLTRKDMQPESAYNNDLAGVVSDLEEGGLLVESDGARCVFLEEFKGKDGTPQPIIVQKTDGGYLYATTDLAAIRYRTGTLKADRVLYLTDARQALHFRQVFALARKAGFTPVDVSLEHVPFGSMLGSNGKPFATRSGGVVKLQDLLKEARERAARVVRERNPDMGEDEVANIARVVGIGAVKYADLSKNRSSDYVFDWDQMLSLEGNTSLYLQYAYARIQSVFRQAQAAGITLPANTTPVARDEHERQLALGLVRLQEVAEQVAQDALPHYLCVYLYDLASRFTRFYEHCPILRADADLQQNRLAFCQATAQTLKVGLSLLGIEVVNRV